MTDEMITVKAVIYSEIGRLRKNMEFYDEKVREYLAMGSRELAQRCAEERNAVYWKIEELESVIAELKEEGVDI